MQLVDDFFNVVKSLEIDPSTMYREDNDELTIVSYKEEVNKDMILHIALIFYPDEESVEVHARKQYDSAAVNESELLKRINEKNTNYNGITFYADTADGFICCKTFCLCDHQIEPVIAAMMQQVEVANNEFLAII